ncbi:MAG: leucine-rich repeat domain-containing protein, partial [Verrucomicrobia bacterium]|nr:leucine-rich repeat domain-containing protein [Verrucomicrobiota bacterium]
AITYGTELSDAQLNATADMEGTFEYDPAIGTKLNAGTQTLTATFTPVDADNYETASASVELVVNKATPIITWETPAAITYGTELTDAQLNATADIEGTFEYDPAIGTKLNAGTQTLTATFTPADADNYETASASVELVVNKATPVITWEAPDAITYGTELSNAQLNATADMEGTFEYSPAVGAKLNAGTQTLTATFTPTDADNYETASASVELLVNKATQTIEFAPLADVREGDDPFELSATASSGLAVTFTSSDPEVASVQGSLVAIGLAGTTTITAVQEGDDNYEAAEAVQTLTVLPDSDFIYVVNEDGTLTITGYRGTEVDLEIPSVINEMTVTIIGAEAFMGNTELRSVIIPETVILIDSQAFAGCSALEEITIPASVESIGDGAFSDCPVLIKVDFMGKVPELPEDVFSGSENVVICYFMALNDPDDLPANVKKVAKDQISLTYKWENGELTLTFTGTLYESEDTVTWAPVEDVDGNTYVVKPNKGKKFYRVGM